MFGQILNNLQKLPKSLIFLQKWQNFGTSGHTACIRWIMGRLPPFIVNLLQSIFFNSRHDARFRYVKRKWSDVISAFVEILDARRQAVAVVDDLPRVHVVVHFRFGHCSKLFERSVLNCSKVVLNCCIFSTILFNDQSLIVERSVLNCLKLSPKLFEDQS